MAGSFETTSIGWQITLWQRRLGEWLERSLLRPAQSENPAPSTQWGLPDWLFAESLYRFLFWFMVITLGGWAIWQLHRLLSPYVTTWFQPLGNTTDAIEENTPTLSTAQWLARARREAAQGNYREACRALYMAALQKLDTAQLVPHEPSRTDGEYRLLLRQVPNARPYQVLINTHERLCFDDAPISVQAYDRCQQAYQDTEPSS